MKPTVGCPPTIISNSNWTEWSTIQGINWASNFKISRARLLPES